MFFLSYPTIETAFFALYQYLTSLRHRAIHESWRSDRMIRFVSGNNDVQELSGKQLDLLLLAALLFMSTLVGDEDPLEASKALHTLLAVLRELRVLHNTNVETPATEWWYHLHYHVSPDMPSELIDIDRIMQFFAERGALPPDAAKIRYDFVITSRLNDTSFRIPEEKVKAGGLVEVALGVKS